MQFLFIFQKWEVLYLYTQITQINNFKTIEQCMKMTYESMFTRFTYEVSPVFILMEEVLLSKMQSIVGWSDDEGDGMFCPGNKCKEGMAEISGIIHS